MHARVRLTGVALALGLTLSACGDGAPSPVSPDRAAADAVASGLSRLGLGKATYDGVARDGDKLVLSGVRGDLAGNGPVRIERIEAEGAAREGGLPASRIAATGVTADAGRTLAARAEARDNPPTGPDPVQGPVWSAEGIDAVLRGAPVKAASLSVTPRANSVEVIAKQALLGIPAFPPLPADMVEDVSALPSDLDLTLTWIENNSIEIRIEQWSSPLGRILGSIVVGSGDMGDPKPIAALAALPLPDLLNPARWPDGVVVRGGSITGNLVHPGFAKAIDAGGPIADPAMRAIAGKLRERLRLGGDNFQIDVRPTRNVEVNKLGAYLAGDPKAFEGLAVTMVPVGGKGGPVAETAPKTPDAPTTPR